MKKKPNRKNANLQISPVKKRIFIGIMLFIPVLLLILLEMGLWLFRYGGDTRLFISTPDATSRYYGINTSIGRRYFHLEDFTPTPRKDLFLKEKPKNSYRIFVLGGSTTAGFPYGNHLTFTRILNRRLSDTFPDRRIEIINTALTAVNSYTLMDFIDEIIKQQPDAVLIYAGHNEFYGALGVASLESLGKIRGVVKTYLKLQRFKTFVLLRNTIDAVRKSGSRNRLDRTADPMQTVMTRIVNKDLKIPLHSPFYRLGKHQFYHNLKDIFKKLKNAGVSVMISELVSNISDHPPFASVQNDTLPSAFSVYQRARVLEKRGQFQEARKAYYLAKDLDVLRFRATEEFNDVIHDLASEYDIPVVPMKSDFEERSPNGLIGLNLMHEHLHPNKAGYFLMAEAFYNAMRKEGFIQSSWPEQLIQPNSFYERNWPFTYLDSVYAEIGIAQLKGGWPFKKSGPNTVLYEYPSKTKEDTLVLQILKTGDLTLELAHIEMARYFERIGEFEKAFEEYRSLIYTVPHLDLFYEPAVKLCVSAKQYNRALKILYEGLKYNDSFFMVKWIGQLHLVLRNTQKGIDFLERARNLNPKDTQLLYNLARAYYNLIQMEKGDAVLMQLKEVAPNATLVEELEQFRKSINPL